MLEAIRYSETPCTARTPKYNTVYVHIIVIFKYDWSAVLSATRTYYNIIAGGRANFGYYNFVCIKYSSYVDFTYYEHVRVSSGTRRQGNSGT